MIKEIFACPGPEQSLEVVSQVVDGLASRIPFTLYFSNIVQIKYHLAELYITDYKTLWCIPVILRSSYRYVLPSQSVLDVIRHPDRFQLVEQSARLTEARR
jgi:hypothetical protein